MSLVMPEESGFQHIIRLLNTNVDGKRRVVHALASIKGVGKRYSDVVCKKAEIDTGKRAGELSREELDRIVGVIQNPKKFDIPVWMLNRLKDRKDGENVHLISNALDNKLREDLEHLKKIRCNRGLRHSMSLRVRGQHTKTTGRRGKTMGVSRKEKA